MKIGLDFDETITRDPELWRMFISAAQARGHEVKIVTFRVHDPENERIVHYNKDVLDFGKSSGVDVIFTHGEAKAKHYEADVWIDDMPHLITEMIWIK